MKRFTIAFLMLALFTVISCTKRIHVEEVAMKADTAMYEGKPFTGEIWTADDRSGSFNTEEGILKSLKFFHENGNTAVEMTINEKGAPITKIYNEEGDSIDLMKFQREYTKIWVNIALTQGELMAK